jgi:hypothetical protein
MIRLVLGILKGLIVGAAVGFGAYSIGIKEGVLLYVVYGAVGALVGIIAGKALWKQETIWTPIVKGLFGFGIGAGLYWVWQRFLPEMHMPMASQLGAPDEPMRNVPYLLGPVIGLIWGALVEIDDGGSGGPKDAPKEAESK